MYVTVEAVKKTLEKMRKVYPYDDNDTVFGMQRSPILCSDSVVCIETVDKETGVSVKLEKDAVSEMPKGE